jgi:hypothetical protein
MMIERSKHTTGEVARPFDGGGSWEDGGTPDSESLIMGKLGDDVRKGDLEAWRWGRQRTAGSRRGRGRLGRRRWGWWVGDHRRVWGSSSVLQKRKAKIQKSIIEAHRL